MKRPKQAQLEEALTKTLHAYEDLIKDVEGNKDKWGDYGSSKTCRLCNLFGWGCNLCPLRGCADGTMDDLRRLVNKRDISLRISKGINKKPTDAEIKKAAMARRDWIILKIAEKGYVYE